MYYPVSQQLNIKVKNYMKRKVRIAQKFFEKFNKKMNQDFHT